MTDLYTVVYHEEECNWYVEDNRLLIGPYSSKEEAEIEAQWMYGTDPMSTVMMRGKP